MPRILPTDAELIAFAEEHLTYEVSMLLGSVHGLTQANNNQFLTNAFVECYTIHLRALIDFLWQPANLREDDAVATDYFLSAKAWENVRPAFPSELEPARGRTGKEIAHLTYARMTVTPQTKGWNVSLMTAAIILVLKCFVANAEKSRIGSALSNL